MVVSNWKKHTSKWHIHSQSAGEWILVVQSRIPEYNPNHRLIHKIKEYDQVPSQSKSCMWKRGVKLPVRERRREGGGEGEGWGQMKNENDEIDLSPNHGWWC